MTSASRETSPNGARISDPISPGISVVCNVGTPRAQFVRQRGPDAHNPLRFQSSLSEAGYSIDYYPKGKRWWVRLHEKGGKRHEMPAYYNLEAYFDAYIEVARIRDAGKAPLFRSAAGRTGTLTERPMNRIDAWRMIQWRAADLGDARQDRLPYFPYDGNYGLSQSRRYVGKRIGQGGTREPAHDKAL
jgi:hypothetical protein